MAEELAQHCDEHQRTVDAKNIKGKVAPVGDPVHARQKLQQFSDAGQEAKCEERVRESGARVGGHGEEGRGKEGREVKMAIVKARERQAGEIGDGQKCAAAQKRGDYQNAPDRSEQG